jgi:hypothetical protein
MPINNLRNGSPAPSYVTTEKVVPQQNVQEIGCPAAAQRPPDADSGMAYIVSTSIFCKTGNAEAWQTPQRKLHQQGYRNIWLPTSAIRWWKSVHFHKKANHWTTTASYGQKHRHRDAAGRVYEGIDEERFILTDDVVGELFVMKFLIYASNADAPPASRPDDGASC